MSDTLISQQVNLPMMPDNQLDQMNPAGSRADLSMPNIMEASMEPLISNPIPLSCIDHRPMDTNSTLSTSVGPEMVASHKLNRSEWTPNNVRMQQFATPVRESGQSQLIKPDLMIPNSPMANKRKATIELIPDFRGAGKMPALNRKVSPIGSFSKASGAMSASMTNAATPGVFGKKVVQLESVKNKSQSTASKKHTQPQMLSKTSTNTNDSVRVKLRESLASALALVSQPQENSSDGKMKTESPTISGKGVGEQPLISSCSNSTANLEPGKPGEASSPPCPNDVSNTVSVNSTSQGMHWKEIPEAATPTWNYMGTSFPSNPVLSGDDVSFGDGFFFKDELLQGNGLSWELELPQVPDVKSLEHIEKLAMLPEEVASPQREEQIVQSPEAVALEVEAELFKLYGGVNKKYKEKGRSLLFNLKDRSNPELRERVMSGKIMPERLCSMTAEELASKELSEWRIAKAEELSLMKVLPDSEANMRRLVKKTHKGEYTVDLDPNIDAMEEIPSGAGISSQSRSRTKSARAATPRKVKLTKEDQDNQCEITIPSDGADMQGLMVDDVGDLPPIVTLDEFMDLLDKEPPFENLSGGTGHELLEENEPGGTSHESTKDNMELGSEPLSNAQPPKDLVKATPPKRDDVIADKRTDVIVVDSTKQADSYKLTDTRKGSDTNNVAHIPKRECVWEGSLQISLSSMANFVAFYISGEKASTKEWPSFFEIKGRVKLDAFDKFVQALPMSRSRAIMVTHFKLNEESTEGDHASLLEVVESYIVEQRLGFAEPAPGVELYLCPPRSKSVDVIYTHLSKSYTDKLKDIDNGLIGLLVWRKVQITPAISPLSSLHHKNNTKTNHFSTSRDPHLNHETDLTNRNVETNNNGDGDDDDDDAPPGFGPPRDDDDLPEFNFSGSSNQLSSRLPDPNLISGREPLGARHLHSRVAAPARQVEQMRELIQKYGQNGNTTGRLLPTQPWNDDDDDIPEWQPQPQVQAVVAPPPPPLPMVHNQSPGFPPHHQFPAQQPVWGPPLQLPQQGVWWPYGPPNTVGNEPRPQPQPSGHFLGTPDGSYQGSSDRGRPNHRGF